MIPGEYILSSAKIICNKDKNSIKITVKNVADRTIQVGSHCHFFEVNDGLKFDRKAAYGKRLDIAAGTSIRLAPGEEREVNLIDLAGERKVFGIKNKVDGNLD